MGTTGFVLALRLVPTPPYTLDDFVGIVLIAPPIVPIIQITLVLMPLFWSRLVVPCP